MLETLKKETKNDIDLLQDVYVPKSYNDFSNVIKKFYKSPNEKKIDVSKYLFVKKCT